jgi:hypothetical protein
MVDLAPGVAAIMALIAQLATKDRDGERRDIGGASGQSHFGARSGIGFQELTVAGTPNLSTLPLPTGLSTEIVENFFHKRLLARSRKSGSFSIRPAKAVLRPIQRLSSENLPPQPPRTPSSRSTGYFRGIYGSVHYWDSDIR